MRSVLGVHWKDWCWHWNFNTLATWCEELTHWKRPWWWERLRAGEGNDRGWDGWVASLTQWTWVWVDSGSWWWTGRPGVLQFMGWQRVGHDWVTGLIDWAQILSELRKMQKKKITLILTKVCGCMLSHYRQIQTLWDPTNFTLPSFSVHGDSLGKNTGVSCHAPLQGIFQTQVLSPHLMLLRWQCMLNRFSRVWLSATLWTTACKTPLSMRFSK